MHVSVAMTRAKILRSVRSGQLLLCAWVSIPKVFKYVKPSFMISDVELERLYILHSVKMKLASYAVYNLGFPSGDVMKGQSPFI